MAAVGAGEPHGTATTDQEVAEPLFVHPTVTALAVTVVVVMFVGAGHDTNVVNTIGPAHVLLSVSEQIALT